MVRELERAPDLGPAHALGTLGDSLPLHPPLLGLKVPRQSSAGCNKQDAGFPGEWLQLLARRSLTQLMDLSYPVVMPAPRLFDSLVLESALGDELPRFDGASHEGRPELLGLERIVGDAALALSGRSATKRAEERPRGREVSRHGSVRVCCVDGDVVGKGLELFVAFH